MQSYIWKGLIGVAFTGGLLALGAGVAYADDTTSGDDGTGSGSQAVIGLNLPISVGGNGVSVLGDSSSSGATSTPPAGAPASGASTDGSSSLLGGSQALLDAHAPVTASGNAISILGSSGSASSTVGSGSPAGAEGTASSGSTSGSTSGDDSTLGGTQVLGGGTAPVTVNDNAISVVGDSSSTGSFAGQSAEGAGSTTPATGTGASTSGDDGILGGSQVFPNVSAPVTASGDAISVVGDSSSSGTRAGGGTGTGTAGGDTGVLGPVTSGTDGVGGGTQIAPVIGLPITVGGNAVSVLGDSSTTTTDPGQPGEVGGGDTVPPATPGTVTTAAGSEQALAVTGVPALPGLAMGLLLFMGGLGVMLRAVAVRR